MPITNDDLLDWSSLFSNAAFTEDQKRQMLTNAVSMSEPAPSTEAIQPVAEVPAYEEPSGGLLDLKDIPDQPDNQGLSAEDFNVQTGNEGTAKQQGLEPWRRNMLSLGAMLSRAGSAMMNDRENGKQVGNTMANYFEGQLYGDARKKALAAALMNSGGGSRPFVNSPMEAMLDLDTRGLNVGQIKDLYDTAYAESSKERQFPIDVAKAVSDLGLREAQVKNYESEIKHRAAVEEETKRINEEKIKDKQRLDEFLVKAEADPDSTLPKGFPREYLPLMKGLGGAGATKLVHDWQVAERQSKKPIGTIEGLVTHYLEQDGKVPEQVLEFWKDKRKKEKEPGMTGYLVTAGDRQLGSIYQGLINSTLKGDNAEMDKLRMLLEKNPLPDQRISALKGEIRSNPKLTKLAEKIPLLEQLTKEYIDRGEQPSGVEYEKAVSAILSGKANTPGPTQGIDKVSAYYPIINKYASATNLEPGLVKSIVSVESKGNPNAVSPKGAVGLMQLMPDTAKMYGVAGKDLFDPDKNIQAGMMHLAKMKKMFGTTPRALIAYNWGDDHVRKDPDLKKIPAESVNYVNKVLGGQIGRGKDGKLRFKYADGRMEDV